MLLLFIYIKKKRVKMFPEKYDIWPQSISSLEKCACTASIAYKLYSILRINAIVYVNLDMTLAKRLRSNISFHQRHKYQISYRCSISYISKVQLRAQLVVPKLTKSTIDKLRLYQYLFFMEIRHRSYYRYPLLRRMQRWLSRQLHFHLVWGSRRHILSRKCKLITNRINYCFWKISCMSFN